MILKQEWHFLMELLTFAELSRFKTADLQLRSEEENKTGLLPTIQSSKSMIIFMLSACYGVAVVLILRSFFSPKVVHLCLSVLRSPSWLKRGLVGLLVLFLVPVSVKFLLDLTQHFVYTHRGKSFPFPPCQKCCKCLSGQPHLSYLQSGFRSLLTSANLLISPLITPSTFT